MRNLALALLAGLAIVGSTPAHAVGIRYPFCMQGNDVPGLSDCSYTSYAQCQATASGRFLYCVQNPYYNPGDQRPGRGGRPVRSIYPAY